MVRAALGFASLTILEGVSAATHGVNYGSRFIVEKFFDLPGTEDVLFKGISSGQTGADPSLCDVGTASDAGSRMSTFLDENIKEEHFEQMAKLGFNTVRLPLGYWNLIDLPNSTTPQADGHAKIKARWLQLQNILPASSYRKWIDQIFTFAEKNKLKIMLDLHGAPGAQAGNAFSGCDLGGDAKHYWDTDTNKQLTLQTLEAMAEICQEKGSTCWGLELLNEPAGGIERSYLKSFYVDAIAAIRKHLAKDVPVAIMDWADQLTSYWKFAGPKFFQEAAQGKVVFTTHLYKWPNPWETNVTNSEKRFVQNFEDVTKFSSSSGFEVLISEWALNSHGSGGDDDHFDYNAFTKWFVEQGDSQASGSFVWNFDSKWSAWGPVAQQQVGHSFVDWHSINGGSSTSAAVLV